jgi:hypothetical protein
MGRSFLKPNSSHGACRIGSGTRLSALGLRTCFMVFLGALVCLLGSAQPLLAQTISQDLSTSVVNVNFNGVAELLGQIALTRSASGGAIQTTQASTLYFQYLEVPISNLFAGQGSVNPVTGIFADSGGITVTVTGGYISAGVTVQVTNIGSGSSTSGILAISLPGGLNVSAGDQIRVSGVKGNVKDIALGSKISCSISALPGGSHSFVISSVGTVGFVLNLTPILITASPLPDALLYMTYSQTLKATGGTAPYTFTLDSGKLPPGCLFITETGEIRGFPEIGGAYVFVVKVTDSLGASGKKEYVMNVIGFTTSPFELNFGIVPVGTTSTLKLTATNTGPTKLDITLGVTKPEIFQISLTSLSLEAGKSGTFSVTFNPLNQLYVNANVLLSIPGLNAIVSLKGRGTSGQGNLQSSMIPVNGSTAGGTRVHIRGQNFRPGINALLGGVALSDLSLISDTELTGTTGSHRSGAVELTIVKADGTSNTLANAFTYRDLPKVSAAPGSQRIPFVIDNDEFRTNLGINNLGDQMATTTVSLVDSNGFLLGQKILTVPAKGLTQVSHIVRFLEDTTQITGREGYLLLESDQPVLGWASQIDNLTLDPSLQISASEVSSRILIPSSVSNGRFATSLLILNSSPSAGHVNVLARNSAGSLQVSLSNLNIASNGYLLFEDFYKTVGLNNVSGPIEIVALDDIQIMASARVFSTDHTGAYLAGIAPSRASKELFLPYFVNSLDFRTNLGVNNPGAKSATVTITLTDKEGEALGSQMANVPSNGLAQFNDIIRALIGSSQNANLEGWIRLNSDQEIFGWTSQIDNTVQDPSFTEAVLSGNSRWLIPSAVKAGTFQSTLVVVNLESAENQVELLARDPAGNVRKSETIMIPGNGMITLPDVLARLGLEGVYGPLEVRSASSGRLLVQSRVYTAARYSGIFEGIALSP